LQAGLIKLKSPTIIASDGSDDITVTFDAAAYTGARMLKPGKTFETTVEAMILQTEGGGATKNGIIQEGLLVSISGNAIELPQNNWGSITVTATVLDRPDTADKQGVAIYLGPLPPLSA